MAAAQKFWVNVLGGVVARTGAGVAIVKFSNVLVFMTEHPPSGGTKGTTVNHIGFQVPDLRGMLDRVKAAGFPLVTRAELPPHIEVNDDVALIADLNASVAFVMGPDETKVEFIERRGMAGHIAMHHIHFAAPDVEEMRGWYVKTLGATANRRGRFETADLPGINLTFSPSPVPVVGTRGRALDRLGFEVKNLEAVTAQLAAAGVAIGKSDAGGPASGVASALITDPWGTDIELTEGLDRIQ